MARLSFEIIKESEVSLNQIREWSDKSPMERHEAILHKYLNHDDNFLKELKRNKVFFGLLGEQIGEFILKDDFILGRGVQKGCLKEVLEKEFILLDSLFLLNLLSKEENITISSNDRIGSASEEFLSKDLVLKWMHPNHFWTENTLFYGPFSYTFDPHQLEGMKEKYIVEDYEETGVKMKEVMNLPLEFVISEINANQLFGYQKWHDFLRKRAQFSIFSSFLAKHLLIDVNEFLVSNKKLFDLRLDEWGIPKENSSFYNQNRLFAIDYKARHIKCNDHGKYHTPAMHSEQRKYVRSLLDTEVGVLILSIQFCDCGRIFYKYILPNILL